MTSLVVVVASQEDDKNGFAAETFGLVTAIMSLVFLMFIRPYQYDDDYLFSVLSVVILCLSTQVSALGEFRRNPGRNSQDQSQYEANIFAVLLWLIYITFRNVIQARRIDRGDVSRWMYFGGIEMMALTVFIATLSSGNLIYESFWLLIGLAAVSNQVASKGQDSSATPGELVVS